MLQRLGYDVVRQRGNHIRLVKRTPVGERHITPAHKTIAKGTLNDILNRVSIWNQIPKRDLLDMWR
jgi:predicted RNA binding protein YcfA (HicA-like mRNA interferase family)